MGAVADFILGGSKITVDGDCSHKIKRYLKLRRKAMTKLDSVLESRDITLEIIVGLKKTLENPLDSKETKPVNPKGN